ncbi:MAG: hypothetical protein J6U20_04195 [Fibrobacter sp.]|nr:hypothetical protein [Fibrobacter sp.]
MKIIINNTERAIFADGKLLIPGTNVLEAFDAEQGDVKSFIENGELEVKDADKMDDKAKEKAVENVTNRETLEKVEKTFPKLDTSKAKKKLDNFDEQLKKQA